MKLSTAVACLAAGAASAAVLTRSEDYKVPGDNPLQYCPARLTHEFIDIQSVDLAPNPPQAAQPLVIKATGLVHKTIQEGATFDLLVKWNNIIDLVKMTKGDFCSNIGRVDLKCPIEPGKMTIEKTVDMPKMIPNGEFFVQAEVKSADGALITCLNGTVSYPSNGFFNIEL
ncbi:hypothetical protein CDD83_7750 [Cordyceps sp. RAO-2017]|nr:hypothetical protein CDD83_7750 [Cordyceps sp. RAO-2017]